MGYSYMVFAALVSAVISQSFCLRSLEVIELSLCTHLKGIQHRELADELKSNIGSKAYAKLLAKCLLLKNRANALLEANLENGNPVAVTSPGFLDSDNLLTQDIGSSAAENFNKRQVRSGKKKRAVKWQVRGGKRGVSHGHISQFGDKKHNTGSMIVDGEKEMLLQMYHGLDALMEVKKPQIAGEQKIDEIKINGGKIGLSRAHCAQVDELVKSAENIRNDLKEWLLLNGVKQKDTEI